MLGTGSFSASGTESATSGSLTNFQCCFSMASYNLVLVLVKTLFRVHN